MRSATNVMIEKEYYCGNTEKRWGKIRVEIMWNLPNFLPSCFEVEVQLNLFNQQN